MKKVYFLTITLLFTAFSALPQEIVEQKDNVKIRKSFQLETSYINAEEELLITPTDNNCTFFIRQDPLPIEFRIISSPNQENLQTMFMTNDLLYINAGANDGLKEGDQFLVLGRGEIFRNPLRKLKQGHFYLKKSLATITCVYDDVSTIQLNESCNSVEINDLVVPYVPQNTVWEKKLDYTLCRIPENALEGVVVHLYLYLGAKKEIAGPGNYVGLELGEGMLERGTHILFYRRLQPGLPLLIVGSGIVIHCEKEICTVKILESTRDIRLGDTGVVMLRTNEIKETLPEPEQPVTAPVREEDKQADREKETEAIMADMEDRIMADLLFDFNSKTLSPEVLAEIEKAVQFAREKSEFILILRGYSCSIGGEEYNLKLSQERVEAVKTILVNQYQIDPARIETYYYGEKEALFDNSQEAERKKNRVVKIEVAGK